jgi:hypothetical protein
MEPEVEWNGQKVPSPCLSWSPIEVKVCFVKGH